VDVAQTNLNAAAEAPGDARLSWMAAQVTATAFFVLLCIVGLALWGLPYYYDFMVRDFGWTRAQVTSGNAYSKLIIGPLFGFLAGWMVDRFGPRRLMLAGILMASVALLGLGSISTLGWFYFFYVFNALGYVCGGPLPNQVLLSHWFQKARGKAMGIAYLGIGIGGAIVPLISKALVDRFGWHLALQILGLIVFAVAFPLAFLVREPERFQQVRAERVPLAGAFQSGPFYLLAVGSMCSIAAVSGTQQNLKLLLTLDLGYSQGAAAQFLSLVLASSILGRLLMGFLADRFPKKYVMLLIYALVAGAIPLLFFGSTPAAMYVFAVVFGIGLGGDYMIIPLMTAEIFGVRILGRLMGVILTADGVAEALSPWLVGHLRDVSGNYTQGLIVLICMAVLGAVAVAFLPRPGHAIEPAP
jgi:MFS family permease